MNAKLTISIAAFFVVFLLENIWPLFHRDQSRWRHDFRNIAIFIINSVILSLIFSSLTFLVIMRVQENALGLFHIWTVSDPWRFALTFLLFDFWMYVWHVLNHRIPFLWRFHRMHHSDPALDATSALRFHTGELIFSSIVRLGVIVLLGMRIMDLIIYETVMMPVIYLHHSNFFMPAWLDKILRQVIITPRVHWVHHSVVWEETNSNYGTIFSWWDRLWRTFRLRDDPRTIEFGLTQMKAEEWQTLTGMLKTPFAFIPNDPPTDNAS